MNSLILSVFFHSTLLQALSTPPPVIFVDEPGDLVIPWHGSSNLSCKVNHTQATVIWLAVRHPPIEPRYFKGVLVLVNDPSGGTQSEVGVLSNEWSRPQTDGHLTFNHPWRQSKHLLSLNEQGTTKTHWIEGLYTCKATLPGYGSLLSRTAYIRLSSAFLEPGLPTAASVLINSEAAEAPSLGGGFYWPNEIVVLRCPIFTIGQKLPIIRWYKKSKTGTDLPIIDETSPKNGHSSWGRKFKTFRLAHGRWLEIHLGNLNMHNDRLSSLPESQVISQRTKQKDDVERLHAAGFGEYFCQLEASTDEASSDPPQSSEHPPNISGPLIRVELDPDAFSSASSIERTSSTSDQIVRWSIKPDIIARLDLPISPALDGKFDKTSQIQRSDRVWRHVNDSISLPCAASVRYEDSRSSIWFSSPVSALQGNSQTTTHQIRWSKNGQRVQWDRRISIVGSGSLLIQQLCLEDSGVYECAIASSKPGYPVLSTGEVDLTVGQAPRLATSSETVLIGSIQSEKNLSCSFSAYPEPRIEWRKNAEPVQNSHYFRIRTFAVPSSNGSSVTSLYHTELSIRSLLPNDAGYFQCFASNRFGSSQFTMTLIVEPLFMSAYPTGTSRETSSRPLQPPRNPRVLSVSDTQVYLTWLPPTSLIDSEESLGYHVRIVPLHSTRALTMNTSRPTVILTDLRPDSLYDIEIYTLRLLDGVQSTEPTSLHVRTKPMVYRPNAVTHLTAEAGEFQALNISWHASKPPSGSLNGSEKVAFYLITLFNLNPRDVGSTPPMNTENTPPLQITVPARSEGQPYYHYTVRDLTPDAFYQVSVQAVTAKNVTGYPAVISSSPRVNSRPPSEPPTQVQAVAIGAHTVTVKWKPPPPNAQNGELILYRINMSCEDWLRPHQINVLGEQSQLIRGLTPATKYEMTVSAATRGGNGPDSPVIRFATHSQENEADREARQASTGYVISEDNVPGHMSISGGHTAPSRIGGKLPGQFRAVENLRYIDDEQNLLLLWSPPINSKSLSGSDSQGTEIDHYLIKWGKLYPGPNTAKVAADQSRFLIDNLDADASYLIDVSTVYKNREVASALITGRTKSSTTRRRLLIPLNLHVASMDTDSVMLIWDEPECNEKPTQQEAQSKCLSKERIQSYQVKYQMIGASSRGDQTQATEEVHEGTRDKTDENWSFTEDTSNDALNDLTALDTAVHFINVTRTWARLDNLLPGRRYSAAVRAVGSGTKSQAEAMYSEWSMTELFETPRRGPEDPPVDVQLTNIPTESGLARLQISWQPPQRPHGQLLSYVLYYTLNHSLPLSKWSKRKLPANSLNTVLNGLHLGAVYFVQMRARNRHGGGPLSPVRLFRTPDASGQGGGEIPLGHEYTDALSIPKEFLSLVLPKVGTQANALGDASSPTTSNGTRWLLTGFVLGSVILLIVILCALMVWRRRQNNFVTRFDHKPETHPDGSKKEKRVQDPPGTFSNQTRRKRKFLNYAQPLNQDIALLVSNGEALVASDIPTTVERKFPVDALTASVTLSAGAFSTGAVTTKIPEGILVHSQLQQQVTTGSWDRDSDSMGFVSVSQQHPEDVGYGMGSMMHDPNRNPTPTRTASGSSNSCVGSMDTPTRIAPNPTYQAHGPPIGVPLDPKTVHSYASMTIAGTQVGPHYMVPSSPLQPIPSNTCPPQIPLNGMSIPPYYHLGSVPGTHSVHLPASGGIFDRHPISPTQFVYPYSPQTVYPGGVVYGVNDGQSLALVPTHQQLMGTAMMNVNTPRVNAADLLSFTSSDDIRPVMSSSIHKDTETHELSGSTQLRNATQSSQNPGSMETQHYATVDHEVTSRMRRLPTVTSPSRSSATTGNIRSPKRRPPPASKSGLRTPGTPLVQKQTDIVKEIGGQKSKCITNGDRSDRNGDGSEKTMNKAFSTEELTQEMANLEGLMKDLSAITREDFNC